MLRPICPLQPWTTRKTGNAGNFYMKKYTNLLVVAFPELDWSHIGSDEDGAAQKRIEWRREERGDHRLNH